MLLSEGSVGAGVRRVEAVTSGAAWALLDERARELQALRAEVETLRKAPEDGHGLSSQPGADVRTESRR